MSWIALKCLIAFNIRLGILKNIIDMAVKIPKGSGLCLKMRYGYQKKNGGYKFLKFCEI